MTTERAIERDERIVIVGGGPVGLALSLILAKYNVPTIVLESRSEPTPRDESRAIVWMPRGLELLEWLGLKEAFDEVAVYRKEHEFRANAHKLMTLSFGDLESPYRYTVQLPQHDTERLLEEAARKTGIVEIRRNHRVTEILEHENRAEMVVEGSSRTYVLVTPWAIGADGARSTIRKELGIGTKWRDYGTDSAVADFEMELDLPKEVSSIVLNPERPYGFFYFSPGRWRFIYRLNQGEDRKAMTTEEAASKLLLEKMPEARIKRFLWASAFRLGQGQSDAYRKGRWLLAGDAAHAMGPSAGAGMMIGLLGAWRLGWRLALAYKGHTMADALLHDYEVEQRAGSDEIQNTNALIFKNMALRNPVLARLRSFGLKFASRIPSIAKGMTGKEALVKQVLPVNNAADQRIEGTWKQLSSYGPWIAGKRIPFIGNEDRLLLHNKLEHTLLSIGVKDAASETYYAEQINKLSNVPIMEQLDLLQDESTYRKPDGKKVVFALVRPDQHVAGVYEMEENVRLWDQKS